MQAEFLKDKSKFTNRLLHSDVEAKGFIEIVNKPEDVWCLVSRDDETDEVFIFHDYPKYDNAEIFDQGEKHIIPPRTGTLLDGVRFWYLAGKNGSKLSVHNCFTYDKPLIEKIWPKCIIDDDVWVDTFIQSKIQYFDRPQRKGAKSPHGLLNYSLMEGNKKPEVEDFSIMNAFMLHRCIVDTKTQKYAYNYLKKEREMLKSKLGICMEAAYKMEVEYTKTCYEQEQYGAKVDVPHIKKCIEYLDKTTEELAKDITPKLPPTIKVSGGKVSRVEMAGLFGYDTSGMKDAMEMVNKDGEMVSQPVKPYYKPTTNFHTIKKVNQYSGFNISYGYSPKFTKKDGLTKWIKSQHPKGDTAKTKELSDFVKEWEVEKNIEETKLLNKNTCDYFEVEPEDTDVIVGAHTKIKFVESSLTQHEVVKGYLIKGGIKFAEEWNLKKDVEGQIIKAEFDTEVRYPPKARRDQQMVLKIKKGDALVTSPKFGEKEYAQLESEDGKNVGMYNTLVHRRRYLENYKDPENKGLLSYVRGDGRVGAGVNNFNTATGRASHRKIVNLPADGAVFGKEMRQCIIADEGKELVGIDQKSSQLSICAFVTNNTDYYEAVATGVEFENDEKGEPIYHGSSAHCVNSRYFNLVTKEEWEDAVRTQNPDLIHDIVLKRKKSKGLSFASLFGCGPAKLALMGGFEVPEAKVKLQAFLDNMGLSEVIKFLEVCREKYKRGKGFYIPTGFGYWVYCGGVHKSTNYLIQSLEGVVQKKAVEIMKQMFIEKGYWEKSVNKILDMHKYCAF
jgi:hypothetical protein